MDAIRTAGISVHSHEGPQGLTVASPSSCAAPCAPAARSALSGCCLRPPAIRLVSWTAIRYVTRPTWSRSLLPHARWALVTGSVMTAHRTAGSDLDIVVRVEDGHPDATYRRSLIWRDWPVELFVYDEPGLERYLARNVAARRRCLQRMIATGVTVAGSDAQIADVRERSRATLAAGPGLLPAENCGRPVAA